MNNKILDFFHNRIVLIVEAVVLALSSIGLTIGGVSASDIEKIGSLAIAALTAIDAIVTFIAALVGKKKE